MFADDRRKYYKHYILGEKRDPDEDDSQAIRIGDLVDCLLLNEEEFDRKFYKGSCTAPPTGKMLDFVTALLKHTRLNTDEDGVVTKEFSELIKDAHADSGFKQSVEVVVSNFIDKDPERYYNEKRSSNGRTVITVQDFHNASSIVEELKSNQFTYELFRKTGDKLTQLVIEDFELYGLKMKCKMDLVTIDHENKQIQIDDLKVTWSVENFKKEYYLYRKAYIQAYVYYKAMQQYKEHIGLSDYNVAFPRFIVADSINYFNPLIYTTSEQDMLDAENGFENYKGVKQIIEELMWAKETNNWRISRTNYLNQGIVSL